MTNKSGLTFFLSIKYLSVCLSICGEVIKSVARLPVARLTCGEVTCYHNRNRPTLTMLRDIGNGTKSDIPPIYQVTVQYFVGISNISTIWF